MSISQLQNCWRQKYSCVSSQLEKVKEIRSVATAFNTNIDAVLKISGKRLSELLKATNLTAEEFDSPRTLLETPQDVVHGIAKCFSRGIAEEWITDDKSVYEWMSQNLGYDRLQMGGQGGIVANALAVLGVQNVFVHTNSHPKLQAQQFLPLNNLFGIDENGKVCRAADIDRAAETPLIHWIIEFDIGDSFTAWGKEFTCPKSNRFIATYDPANIDLVINPDFVKHLSQNGYDYLVLSGYHNLTSKRNGVELVNNSIALIKDWKKHNPQGIIHLELASTQDKKVRAAIIEKIAPLADSLGLNEREALDALEVVNPQKYQELAHEDLTSPRLFEIVRLIKEKTQAPRIQLHMFGLYLTLQDKDFRLSAEQNLRGMMLASTVAATKAGTGKIEDHAQLLWAHGKEVSEISLNNLQELSEYLQKPELIESGICQYENYDVIAVPTIIIEKPLTLVGMGDTISSVSLIGAR